MKKLTRNMIIGGAALGIIVLATAKLVANQREVANKVYTKDPNATVSIKAHTVNPGSFEQTSTYVGTFEPNREVVLGAETSGKIIAVGIAEGSKVAAGALVAQVDNELYKAQLYSAEANYENASTTLQRYQNAAVGDGVSATQLDQQKLQMKSAEAQVRQLKKQIAMSRITAPFAGVVTEKMVELGATVAPGTQLAKISDLSSLKLELSIPEKDLANFTEGSEINIVTDVYPDTRFKGTVDLVSVSADAAHQFTVKIRIPNSQQHPLKAGMYGKIQSETDDAGALIIPRSALLGSAKSPQVFVIKDGAAVLRSVKIGRSNDVAIEITEGLQAGDVVATSGLVNLSNGTKVNIAR